MRMVLFAELVRKWVRATGRNREILERQMAKGIKLGPNLQKYEFREGPNQQAVITEEIWQQPYDKMLPRIEEMVNEAETWRANASSSE